MWGLPWHLVLGDLWISTGTQTILCAPSPLPREHLIPSFSLGSSFHQLFVTLGLEGQWRRDAFYFYFYSFDGSDNSFSCWEASYILHKHHSTSLLKHDALWVICMWYCSISLTIKESQCSFLDAAMFINHLISNNNKINQTKPNCATRGLNWQPTPNKLLLHQNLKVTMQLAAVRKTLNFLLVIRYAIFSIGYSIKKIKREKLKIWGSYYQIALKKQSCRLRVVCF